MTTLLTWFKALWLDIAGKLEMLGCLVIIGAFVAVFSVVGFFQDMLKPPETPEEIEHWGHR